jgi:V/A-type H+-transporting ATPase subunit D
VTGSDRAPSGRAGRLWLTHRIDVAERAADQLERKIHVLGLEIARQQAIAAAARVRWTRQWTQANRWAIRAAFIGGQQEVRNNSAPPVEVTLTWVNTVGVRHPESAVVGKPTPRDGVVGAAAIVPATAAFAEAMRAGVDLAIADATCRALDDARTHARRRARLLRRRWLPVLRDNLHALELALEQAEQEDHARLRLRRTS